MNRLNELKSACLNKIKENTNKLIKTGYTSFILEVGDLFFDFDTNKKAYKVRELVRVNGRVQGNKNSNNFPLLHDNDILEQLLLMAQSFDQNQSNRENEKKSKDMENNADIYLKLLH